MHINHEIHQGYLLEADVTAIAMCYSFIFFSAVTADAAAVSLFFIIHVLRFACTAQWTAIGTDLVVVFFCAVKHFFSVVVAVHAYVFWLDDFMLSMAPTKIDIHMRLHMRLDRTEPLNCSDTQKKQNEEKKNV